MIRFPLHHFLPLAVAAALATCAAAPPAPTARSQTAFGVEMARRGLWSEALFRFRAARELAPADPEVLNNLAVALEAGGRFDEALAVYGEALKLAPENRSLKQNYSRFVEFYQSFRSRPSPPAAATAAPPPGGPGD